MKTIKVAAAVICADGRVFAAQRGCGVHKGRWEFPGGKLEAGETAEEALRREIREELALEIRVGGLIDTVEYDYPDFHLSMSCFWAEILTGEPVLLEAESARWLSAGEFSNVDWLPPDRILLEKVRQGLTESGQREDPL